MTDVELADVVDAYLERKAVGDPDGSGAGAYASNAESILRRWVEWLEREHGVDSPFALEVEHMQSYAGELGERADSGEYAASTATTYYNVVRAFLSWCVRGGIIDSNPAATRTAADALPSEGDRERPSGGSGTSEQRRALVNYVEERALESVGAGRRERLRRLRECALVSLLAHTGVRGAELFRVPEDDRRNGATWDDVDFYRGTLTVLGRSGRLEDVDLPAPARTPLRRYRTVLDPPSTDWPLFPTRHAPSIASRVRSTLRERGHDDDEVESLLEGTTATELARERSIAPPAITTEGARSVLRRLCEDAAIDVDGDYLTPRRARGERDEAPTRRDATAGTSLRQPSRERSLAVVESRPFVLGAEAGSGVVDDERAED